MGYKNVVCTWQETHYISATEPSRLILRKTWGFHGCDYKECRLFGYKNTVRTSQETHYVTATEPKRLMLLKIWGFHGDDYEECRLLGCYAVRRNIQVDGILQVWNWRTWGMEITDRASKLVVFLSYLHLSLRISGVTEFQLCWSLVFDQQTWRESALYHCDVCAAFARDAFIFKQTNGDVRQLLLLEWGSESLVPSYWLNGK
jgi:hypothetical protein